MTQSLHARLVATQLPRDSEVVMPYVRAGTSWAAKTLLILGAFVVGLGLLMGIADSFSGRRTLPMSLLTGLGYGVGMGGAFFLAPVVAFWLTHRRRLKSLLIHGELRPATVTERGVLRVRNSETPTATITYLDVSGHQRQAMFQAPHAAELAVGNTVQVIADRTSSVAILWAPDGLVLARRK